MNNLLTTPALNVYEQMALDEVLVRAYAGGTCLRLYHWVSGPALTFGYSQFMKEVQQGAAAQSFTGPVCRRPTGGGVVYHTDDLTFSLVFSCTDKPTVIYEKLHRFIRQALAASGVFSVPFTQKLPASAYAPSQHHTANACFVNPVENDLLLQTGQKMLGGAIRRFGTTVLYQGSLQIPRARENPSCKQGIISGVRAFLGTDLRVQAINQQMLAEARTLAQTQYKTPAWTEKF